MRLPPMPGCLRRITVADEADRCCHSHPRRGDRHLCLQAVSPSCTAQQSSERLLGAIERRKPAEAGFLFWWWGMCPSGTISMNVRLHQRNDRSNNRDLSLPVSPDSLDDDEQFSSLICRQVSSTLSTEQSSSGESKSSLERGGRGSTPSMPSYG